MFGIQFYPTPIELAKRMTDKIDWKPINSILEPSAGKGDLLNAVNNAIHNSVYKNREFLVEAVEIDSDLCAILKERQINVLNTDFLRYKPYIRYDLCIMNPPFANGDLHLLHAIDIMKHGGQIVCLLNAETVKNDFSNTRRELANKLQEYNAEIEFINDAFAKAERRTDIEIAMVYINIPYEQDKTPSLDELKQAVDVDDSIFESTDIVVSDFVKSIIQQYDFEAKAGLKIIDEYYRLGKYIPKDIIQVSVSIKEPFDKLNLYNQFLYQLRYMYWEKLFRSNDMRRLMTEDIQDSFLAKLESFRNYDFNYDNIMKLKVDLSQTLCGNIEKATIKMFDKLTYHCSMEKDKNIHYYNGWKTNNAFAIGKKSIVYIYDLRDQWGWNLWRARDFLYELEQVLSYLDKGDKDGNDCYDVINSVDKHGYDGERIHFKYFDAEFKKKGTVHIFYTDMSLIKKMNIFAGKEKNWLPHDYGRKAYGEMNEEERDLVNSFEGEKEYADTHTHVNELTFNTQLLLGA